MIRQDAIEDGVLRFSAPRPARAAAGEVASATEERVAPARDADRASQPAA